MFGLTTFAESSFATAGVDQVVQVFGVQGATYLGTASVTAAANTSVSGVEGQTQLGTTNQTAAAQVYIVGFEAQSYLGTT